MNGWKSNLLADLAGPRAYRTWALLLTTLVTSYFALHAVMDSRHDRQMEQARFERTNFMTMVLSNNQGAFVSAIKNFGWVQTMEIPEEPSIFVPWRWSKTVAPNMEPLQVWAESHFELCKVHQCGTVAKGADPEFRISLRSSILVNTDLTRAHLNNSDLRGANLTGAKLRVSSLAEAMLTDADLTRAELHRAKLMNADLSDAHLIDATMTRANLDGADLTRAHLLRANLTDAYLANTTLTRADLTEADLTGATLTNARLESTRLYGANLKGSRNLTMKQLLLAFWNEETKWPEGVSAPCPRSVPDEPCDHLSEFRVADATRMRAASVERLTCVISLARRFDVHGMWQCVLSCPPRRSWYLERCN